MILQIINLLLFCKVNGEVSFHNDQNIQIPLPNQGLSFSSDLLTLYLIPHSHDDVGWLQNVDQYYYRSVQYIIDSVVNQLSQNPSYKFSIVQMVYLYKWWENAKDSQKVFYFNQEQLKKLIQNKQIEIINGGWCMNDQASPYYEDIIDQMTLGLQWVKNTFDFVPSVGWHIDPFGHQSSQAAIFSQMGFNAWVFSRIDYQDKQTRMKNLGLQTLWKPVQYSNQDNSILTHVSYRHYSSPPGFCFDVFCSDPPIMDDQNLQGYNIEARSDQFVSYFRNMQKYYRTTTLLHTLGDDFQFVNSHVNFKNIDKLINYINANTGKYNMKIMLSTPGQYFAQIYKQQASYPIKQDDFMPYAGSVNDYWTGYFTSRVGLKGFVKYTGRYLQAIRTFLGIRKIKGDSDYVKNSAKEIQKGIWELQNAMGILQHHDAVSGTAKQRVTNDYFFIGCNGVSKINQVFFAAKKEQAQKEISQQPEFFTCYWNMTTGQCLLSDKIEANKTILVTIYNPGSAGQYPIRFKIKKTAVFKLLDKNNAEITGQLFCNNLTDTNDCQLLFYMKMESRSNEYVKLVGGVSNSSVKILNVVEMTQNQKDFQFSNKYQIKFIKNGQLFQIIDNGSIDNFSINFGYYESYQGGQNSGAYVFRPSNKTQNKSLEYSPTKNYYYIEGELAAFLVLKGDYTVTTIIFYNLQPYFSTALIQTWLDSIPIEDQQGKQIVIHISSSDIQNRNIFYTDSNGLELQKRQVNYRPQWQLIVNQPVAGNYYPIGSFISISDFLTQKNITVMVDRSQGGTSFQNGTIQLMIHRRILRDDGKGVGEALNELDWDGKGMRQLVRHTVILNKNQRPYQKIQDQLPILLFAQSAQQKFNKYQIQTEIFNDNSEVKYYLRPYEDGSYLFRIQNFNSKNNMNVSIPDNFKIEELTLGGNQNKSDWQKNRMKWKGHPINSVYINKQIGKDLQGNVEVGAFEIKTYKLIL